MPILARAFDDRGHCIGTTTRDPTGPRSLTASMFKAVPYARVPSASHDHKLLSVDIDRWLWTYALRVTVTQRYVR